jgi:two-component system phosphate regulon sensor histidine kinase PhoR
MFRSIRWRIGVPYVLLILVTMIGLELYLSNFLRETYLENLETKLSAEARLMSDTVATYLSNGESYDTLDRLAKTWADQLGTRVTIIARDGTVIGESHENRAEMENHLNRPEIIQALETGQGNSSRFSRTLASFLMYLAVPVKDGAHTIAFVRVALPLDEIEANIQHLQQALLGATLLATSIAVLLAIWIPSRALRPLREVTEATTQISSGFLGGAALTDHTLQRSSQDEIGQLTRSFNNMSIQLRAQIDALETERSKMAAVLSVMTDGVLIVDSDGMIQLINPAAESIFGVSQQDALGSSLMKALRDYQFADLWQRCRYTGEQQFTSIEIGSRNLYLQGAAIPLDFVLPGNTLLLFQNLTRLRRLETIRQDFISNISHELRTPLASLKALTETLLEGALDDPPAARRFLERMETEVDALSLMVSELLELSRIESGRVPLKMAPCSPHELVTQAIERLRLQAERAQLSIHIACPEDLPLVLADENRLIQVLVNLLHNAIKFTPEGGEIRVDAEAQEDKVIFIVQDTGIGIPQEDLTRIFERFYKTDRARSSGGTGLGLAISRHLVESHGGRIWVESVEGKGSCFYFSIPKAC